MESRPTTTQEELGHLKPVPFVVKGIHGDPEPGVNGAQVEVPDEHAQGQEPAAEPGVPSVSSDKPHFEGMTDEEMDLHKGPDGFLSGPIEYETITRLSERARGAARRIGSFVTKLSGWRANRSYGSDEALGSVNSDGFLTEGPVVSDRVIAFADKATDAAKIGKDKVREGIKNSRLAETLKGAVARLRSDDEEFKAPETLEEARELYAKVQARKRGGIILGAAGVTKADKKHARSSYVEALKEDRDKEGVTQEGAKKEVKTVEEKIKDLRLERTKEVREKLDRNKTVGRILKWWEDTGSEPLLSKAGIKGRAKRGLAVGAAVAAVPAAGALVAGGVGGAVTAAGLAVVLERSSKVVRSIARNKLDDITMSEARNTRKYYTHTVKAQKQIDKKVEAGQDLTADSLVGIIDKRTGREVNVDRARKYGAAVAGLALGAWASRTVDSAAEAIGNVQADGSEVAEGINSGAENVRARDYYLYQGEDQAQGYDAYTIDGADEAAQKGRAAGGETAGAKDNGELTAKDLNVKGDWSPPEYSGDADEVANGSDAEPSEKPSGDEPGGKSQEQDSEAQKAGKNGDSETEFSAEIDPKNLRINTKSGDTITGIIKDKFPGHSGEEYYEAYQKLAKKYGQDMFKGIDTYKMENGDLGIAAAGQDGKLTGAAYRDLQNILESKDEVKGTAAQEIESLKQNAAQRGQETVSAEAVAREVKGVLKGAKNFAEDIEILDKAEEFGQKIGKELNNGNNFTDGPIFDGEVDLNRDYDVQTAGNVVNNRIDPGAAEFIQRRAAELAAEAKEALDDDEDIKKAA